MAKNPALQRLLPGVCDVTSEAVDIKYKEIVDGKMASVHDNHEESGKVNSRIGVHDVTPVRPNGPHDSAHGESSEADSDVVPCPTCRGTGTIRTDDSSLVALIPVKDERLKPKRTKLKMVLAIVVTLLICGVIIYFLFPRTPTLYLISVVQRNSSFPHFGDAHIMIKIQYSVENNNYVSVDLTSLSVVVTWRKLQVGGPHPYHKFHAKEIALRSSVNFDVYVNTTYNYSPLRYLCMYGAYLNLQMSTEVESSFLFHTEKFSSNDVRDFLCYYNGTAAVTDI